jgi:hypothetical protein
LIVNNLQVAPVPLFVPLQGSESHASSGQGKKLFYSNKYNVDVIFYEKKKCRKKASERAKFRILSPVRLPFRHTGGIEITAFTFAKVFSGRKQPIRMLCCEMGQSSFFGRNIFHI